MLPVEHGTKPVDEQDGVCPCIHQLLDEQAGDPGLWCEPANIVEHHLQQELRRLHRVIEMCAATHGTEDTAPMSGYCTTCGDLGRIACPGPNRYSLTMGQMEAAGLRMTVDFCYGMHMGHPCPDCQVQEEYEE